MDLSFDATHDKLLRAMAALVPLLHHPVNETDMPNVAVIIFNLVVLLKFLRKNYWDQLLTKKHMLSVCNQLMWTALSVALPYDNLELPDSKLRSWPKTLGGKQQLFSQLLPIGLDGMLHHDLGLSARARAHQFQQHAAVLLRLSRAFACSTSTHPTPLAWKACLELYIAHAHPILVGALTCYASPRPTDFGLLPHNTFCDSPGMAELDVVVIAQGLDQLLEALTAEELARWQALQGSAACRDFLATFPDCVSGESGEADTVDMFTIHPYAQRTTYARMATVHWLPTRHPKPPAQQTAVQVVTWTVKRLPTR